MMKKLATISAIIVLIVGCKNDTKPTLPENDFLNKTQVGFGKMSDWYYANIYFDFEDDKGNQDKESLYQFAYSLRIKTGNLKQTLKSPENFDTFKDSINSFSQFIFTQIDSISDPIITGFINNQLEYKNVIQDKLSWTDKTSLSEIWTDIKIVEYFTLDFLYNKHK